MWRGAPVELHDFCATVSSKPLAEKKGPVLIRLLVLKLPIDFQCGGLWGGDLLRFPALTKAKLSHLETGYVYRHSWSALTPPANLFPSGRTFLFFFPGAAQFHHRPTAEVSGRLSVTSCHLPAWTEVLTICVFASVVNRLKNVIINHPLAL